MIKILVITYGSEDHASSRTRIIQYFDYLKANQFSVFFLPQRPIIGSGMLFILYRFLFKKMQVFRKTWGLIFNNIDIVFVSRVLLTNFDLFLIKKRKIKLIYDFDDALFLGSSNNSKKLTNCIKTAEKVIVSTSYLTSFCASNGVEAFVLPTSVNTDDFHPNLEIVYKKTVTIGWIGSPSTEKYLYGLESIFKQLCAKYPEVEILVVGSSENFTLQNVRLKKSNWSIENEAELVRNMDIGIMPLTEDKWSMNKGGYKLYLYFSTGIPCVASPVGVNKEVVDHGENGYLATTEEEWVNYLSSLIEDPKLRVILGNNGLEKCLEKYAKATCEQKLYKILTEK